MGIDLDILMILTLVGMLLAIFSGVHIALALGATAMIGTYFIFEDMYMAASQVGGAAYELIRDHIFMTIPLFVLMGDFLSRSGAAGDLYSLINKGLKGVPGRLGVATVTGNAAFAAVTGTSIASAAAFSRIAWPEMKKAGYDQKLAVGSIAGSACLGMLIPPSVLLIVWEIVDIRCGVIPGIILSLIFYNFKNSLNPDVLERLQGTSKQAISRLFLFNWLFFKYEEVYCSYETSEMGILQVLVLLIQSTWMESVIDAGKTSAPIMILLITAGMYSRFLSLSDIDSVIVDAMASVGLNSFMILVMMVVIWLILGMLLDSISIILLTVPLFVLLAGDMNPYAFAIFGILAIEAGLLTPPFGLIVYTVKGVLAAGGDNVSLGSIFKGSIPYWIMMLIVMLLVAFFPELASWPTQFV